VEKNFGGVNIIAVSIVEIYKTRKRYPSLRDIIAAFIAGMMDDNRSYKCRRNALHAAAHLFFNFTFIESRQVKKPVI